MTLSISLLKRRAAYGPGIGRRRRVVGLAAFAGRLLRYMSHIIYTASASYPPCPPSRGRGFPLERFPPESCFTGNIEIQGMILLISFMKHFLLWASEKFKRVIQGYGNIVFLITLYNPFSYVSRETIKSPFLRKGQARLRAGDRPMKKSC